MKTLDVKIPTLIYYSDNLNEIDNAFVDISILADNLYVIYDNSVKGFANEIIDALKSSTAKKILKFQSSLGINTSESLKTMETVLYIENWLFDVSADRNSFVLAIGGGVLSDIVGFAASIYRRGIHFGFVPTTLLSQVDASVGGKNGVNFRSVKNMLGVINQPEFVFLSSKVLETLSLSDFTSGEAELLKSFLIEDDFVPESVLHEYALFCHYHSLSRLPLDNFCETSNYSKVEDSFSLDKKSKINTNYSLAVDFLPRYILRHYPNFQSNLDSLKGSFVQEPLLSSSSENSLKLQSKLNSLEHGILTYLISEAVKVKADIVSRDPYERGERRKLNLGHTIGHALEALSILQSEKVFEQQQIPRDESACEGSEKLSSEAHLTLSHGEAVSLGILCAVEDKQDLLNKLRTDFAACGLPTMLPSQLRGKQKEIQSFLRHDKKSQGKYINYVLLDRIGEITIEKLCVEQIVARLIIL